MSQSTIGTVLGHRKESSPSFYIALIYIVSLLLFNISNHLIPHILFLVWIVSAFLFDSKALLSILSRKYYMALYVFLLYYFVSSLLAFSPGTCVNRVYTYFELISPFIMYELYSKYDDKKKVLLCVVFLVVFVLNFYQMMTTINYSAIAGLRQHEDEEGFLNTGFHFVYSLTLVFCLIVYIIRQKLKKGDNNVFLMAGLFIWLMFIALIVFKSLFTTAILLMLVGAVLAFFYGRKHWKRKILITGVVASFLFIYGVPFVEKQLLQMDSEYAIITSRLDDISNAMQGGDMDDDSSMGARFNRSILSLKTFFSYPLFGVNHLTANRDIFDAVLIGNHAEWVDSMAEYGIFAFLLFFFFIKSAKLVARKRGVTVVFILYVIIGFLNPVLYCVQNTICFFIIPMIYDLLLPQDSKVGQINLVNNG